ncbi:MAG: 50S ribosomal protein L24 [Candidatus Bathyarchaeota archaeon]
MKTTKPGKQRKRLYQAPLNERYKRFSAPLSSKLKESHGANSVPVRNGDTVMIMRGDRKGSEGKVTQINRKKYRIFIEGATREKVDGTTTFIPIHPSKVMITRLNLDDKWRKKILERKGVTEKAEIAEEEPPKKKAKKKRKTSKKTKKSGGI